MADSNSIIPGLDIVASGMYAARRSLEIDCMNLSNQNVTKTEKGGPYKAFSVVLENESSGSLHGLSGKVKIAQVIENKAEGLVVLDPTHPHADEKGMVHLSNVEPAKEILNMVQDSSWHHETVVAAKVLIEAQKNGLSTL